MARRFEMVLPNDSLVAPRIGFEGFSWTVFFFGPFPMFIRGDFPMGLIAMAVGIVLALFTYGIGAWVAWLILACVYNRMYTRKLEDKGFRPAALVLQQQRQIANGTQRMEPSFSTPQRDPSGVGPGLR